MLFEFRVFWDKWRLDFDVVYYSGDPDYVGLYALYLGPFVFAYHTNPPT